MYQVNWKQWDWPWHSATIEHDYGAEYFSHFAGIGPFQFHWYSRKASY